MGADTSSTHLIFFIVSMLIAVGVVGVIHSNINVISQSVNIASDALSDQILTDIIIINDPANIPHVNGVYTFYVKNIGSSTLSIEHITVLINGAHIQPTSIKVINSIESTWKVTEVVQIEIMHNMTGDNTIKIITERGVVDSLNFVV